MPTIAALTEAERRELEQLAGISPPDRAAAIRAVLLAHRHYTTAQIAQLLGQSEAAVRDNLAAFEAQGVHGFRVEEASSRKPNAVRTPRGASALAGRVGAAGFTKRGAGSLPGGFEYVAALARGYSPYLLVASLILAAIGQYLLAQSKDASGSARFYIAAAIVFLAFLALGALPDASYRLTSRSVLKPSACPPYLLVISGLLIFTSLASIALFSLLWLGVASWIASIATVMVSAIVANRQALTRISKRARGFFHENRWEIFLVASIIVIGAAIRMYDLTGYPSGIHHDEGGSGVIARQISTGNGPNPFGTAWFGNPAMFMYSEALAMLVFGRTLEALRFFAALNGVATLSVFYVFTRRLLGLRVALLSLVILSTEGAHITYSRMAMNVPQVTLFACLSFLCIIEARRNDNRWWWVIAGMSGAATFYFHFSGLFLPLATALYFGYLWLFKRQSLRYVLISGVFLAIGYIIVLAPIVVTLFQLNEFIGHAGGRMIFSDWPRVMTAQQADSVMGVLWGQLRTNTLAFFATPDNSFYYFARTPLFSPILAPFVVLGSIYLVWRIRDERYALLAIWMWTVIILGGVLTVDSPQSHRTLAAVLPVAIGAALVLDLGVRLGSRSRRASTALPFGLAAGLVVTGAGGLEVRNFFGPAAAERPWELTTAQAQFAAALGPTYRAYTMDTPGVSYQHEVRQLLAPDVEGGDVQNPAISLPVAVAPDRDLALLVFPQMAVYLPPLRELYPNAQEQPVIGRDGKPIFTGVRIPRADVAARQGLTANYGGGDRLETDPSSLGGGAPGYPVSARWSGSLYVPEPGRYTLAAVGTESEIRLAGAPVDPSSEVSLTTGWQPLEVRARLDAATSRITLQWRPPKQALAPIPPPYFDQQAFRTPFLGSGTRPGVEPIERRDRLIGFRDLGVALGQKPPLALTWAGTLNTPTAGRYEFRLTSAGVAQAMVDGQSIAANQVATADVRTATGSIDLAAGPHQIRVDYAWPGGLGIIELVWVPPSGTPTVVTAESFTPAVR